MTRHKSPTHTIAGFTLIELLIVVAIIAIMSALSISAIQALNRTGKPEATRQQLLLLADALDAYHLKTGALPSNVAAADGTWYLSQNAKVLTALTTPVSYMSNIPEDRYLQSIQRSLSDAPFIGYWNFSGVQGAPANAAGVVISPGPDLCFDSEMTSTTVHLLSYDPTNGINSSGDIFVLVH